MDQIDYWPWIKGGFYVLTASLLLAVVISGSYGQTAAAWAQAIGTIAAIGGAAWIAQGQMRQARAADEAQTHAYVQSIQVELDVLWLTYRQSVGDRLMTLSDGQPFLLDLPVRQDVFKVYPGDAGRLGKIDDAQLRRVIVRAYDHAASLAHALGVAHQLTIASRAPLPDGLSLEGAREHMRTQKAVLLQITHAIQQANRNMETMLNDFDRLRREWEKRKGYPSDDTITGYANSVAESAVSVAGGPVGATDDHAAPSS